MHGVLDTYLKVCMHNRPSLNRIPWDQHLFGLVKTVYWIYFVVENFHCLLVVILEVFICIVRSCNAYTCGPRIFFSE